MSIKCGNCKEYHESTQAVRECYAYRTTSATIASYAPMGSVQEELPFPKSPATPSPAAAGDKWDKLRADVAFAISVPPGPNTKMITENQINFINSLLSRRECPLLFTDQYVRRFPRTAASWVIEALLAAPLKDGKRPSPGHDKQADLPDIPAGRYAVTGADGTVKFYKVDRPTEGRWAGYVFVKVQAGDDYHRVPAQRAILKQIAEQGIQECMLRYGRELGHCGHCGRTLTNDESRELGIGPVCREKMGF